MSDFVQTMKDWRRMCDTIQSDNQKRYNGGWCKGCPLQGLCVIDTSIKDATDRELNETGSQIQSWAAEHPEPVYPTWYEYLSDYYRAAFGNMSVISKQPIPADIARKLGIEPKAANTAKLIFDLKNNPPKEG